MHCRRRFTRCKQARYLYNNVRVYCCVAVVVIYQVYIYVLTSSSRHRGTYGGHRHRSRVPPSSGAPGGPRLAPAGPLGRSSISSELGSATAYRCRDKLVLRVVKAVYPFHRLDVVDELILSGTGNGNGDACRLMNHTIQFGHRLVCRRFACEFLPEDCRGGRLSSPAGGAWEGAAVKDESRRRVGRRHKGRLRHKGKPLGRNFKTDAVKGRVARGKLRCR